MWTDLAKVLTPGFDHDVRVDAGAELTRSAGFGLTRVRPMNALVSR